VKNTSTEAEGKIFTYFVSHPLQLSRSATSAADKAVVKLVLPLAWTTSPAVPTACRRDDDSFDLHEEREQ